MARRRFDLKVQLPINGLPLTFQLAGPSSNAAAPFQPSVPGKHRDTNARLHGTRTPSAFHPILVLFSVDGERRAGSRTRVSSRNRCDFDAEGIGRTLCVSVKIMSGGIREVRLGRSAPPVVRTLPRNKPHADKARNGQAKQPAR